MASAGSGVEPTGDSVTAPRPVARELRGSAATHPTKVPVRHRRAAVPERIPDRRERPAPAPQPAGEGCRRAVRMAPPPETPPPSQPRQQMTGIARIDPATLEGTD